MPVDSFPCVHDKDGLYLGFWRIGDQSGTLVSENGGVGLSDSEVISIASHLSALSDLTLSPQQIETVRLIVHGNSVIDWNRLAFHSRDDVNRFLRLHLLDPDDAEDQRRLRFVYGESVNYLEEHLGLHFPEDLRNPEDVRDVFIVASETGGFRRRQIQACVILKLMHVINHLETAELKHQTPLSEAELLDLAERRIVAAADQMRKSGFPLVAFYGSRKTRNSVITKLLAKKENTAATIFDKLRFRIVTEKQEHILPAIAWLTENLFPFNYLIPGESYNNLVHLSDVLQRPEFQEIDRQGGSETEDETLNPEENPFSGSSYRMVNFIVDFPVRVDHLVNVRYGALLGRTAMVLVEFQVLDKETAKKNEEGENAHRLYKQRQRGIVSSRLKKGARYKKKR
jgi:uncharacterized protein (TIGR04552 family)